MGPPGPHPPLTGLRHARRLAPLYAYRAASGLARSLPAPVADRVAVAAGRAMGRLLAGRRVMVGRHLQRIHGPSLTGDALDREVRRTFDSYARYWLESFRLPGMSPDALAAAMTCEGLEHVTAAVDAGRGVIVALPHLGGWDFGGAWLASVGYPATVVVEALEPPELLEWFARFRQSLGLTVVPLDQAAGTIVLRTLRAGGIVGLVCERDIAGNGIEVDLLGERTTMPAGPATLALRTGAAIVPAAVYFTDGGGHRGVIRPPLEVERRGTLREDVARITQALAGEMESFIRAAPEQWHLLQPNWPSDHEFLRNHAR
ncbi:MAG TPA: phosphatidylinositol mannoside acyltransferase [Acidimicrobiales bacterium]|nr:phosphatidylinositol mannoside acyltransferase [Acidimicrobiales bacterium]